MFSVGSKIVHPMHGAGIIQKIEEKKILGEVKQYYILKLPCNDMNRWESGKLWTSLPSVAL